MTAVDSNRERARDIGEVHEGWGRIKLVVTVIGARGRSGGASARLLPEVSPGA